MQYSYEYKYTTTVLYVSIIPYEYVEAIFPISFVTYQGCSLNHLYLIDRALLNEFENINCDLSTNSRVLSVEY